MKNTFLFLSLFIVITLVACDISVSVAPSTSPAPLPTNTMLQPGVSPIPETVVPTQIPASVTPVPATIAPSATATTLQPSFEGVEVSVDPLSIVLAPGIAGGARGSQFPRLDGDEVSAWELTPGHIQLKLEGYALQGKFHEPEILVYPALEYAQLYPAAFESMHRLNNTLFDPAAAVRDNLLPLVPFFNARQLFASNIQVISFQNGRGVRFLTEYGQSAASANNYELFYHFQGFSSDGTYYVIAILPITAPVLAETGGTAAALPPGGIVYPDITAPNVDMQSYYTAVTTLLNATSPQAFTPSIDQLDLLIQSMRITP